MPNIAPYNSYAGLATYPPMLGVSFSQRAGEDKHTLANIKATGVFVINLVPRFLAEIMNTSRGRHRKRRRLCAPGPDACRCRHLDCPRIGESPASLECRVTDIMALPPSKCEFVVAQIVGIHLRDEFVKADGTFRPRRGGLAGKYRGGRLCITQRRNTASAKDMGLNYSALHGHATGNYQFIPGVSAGHGQRRRS